MDATDGKQRCPHFVTEQMIDRALARTKPTGDLIATCPRCGDTLTVSFRVTRVSETQLQPTAEQKST